MILFAKNMYKGTSESIYKYHVKTIYYIVRNNICGA